MLNWPVACSTRTLVDYLALEERFSQSGQADAFAALSDLVTRVRAGDPQADAARYDELLQRISGKQRTVSARELFQEDLRCYRPDRRSRYEIPVRPAIEESAAAIVATLPMLAGQAPVRRIDLEGVGLASFTISGSSDGATFDEVQRCTGKSLAGAAGAWLTSSPLEQSNLRLSTIAPTEEARCSVNCDSLVKNDPPSDCGYATVDPAMVASFEGRPWSPKPQGGAFLQREKQRFAGAPTGIRVTRTRSDLYVAVEAGAADHLPRSSPILHPARRAAVETGKCRALAQARGKLPLRLIVSPLGTQYDSETSSGGWDGEWEVVTGKHATGWSALFQFPSNWSAIPNAAAPFRSTSCAIAEQ